MITVTIAIIVIFRRKYSVVLHESAFSCVFVRNMTDNGGVDNIIVITIILAVSLKMSGRIFLSLFLSIRSSAIDRISGRGNCVRNTRSSSYSGQDGL